MGTHSDARGGGDRTERLRDGRGAAVKTGGLVLAKIVALWCLLTLACLVAWLLLTVIVNTDQSVPVSSQLIFIYLMVSVLAFGLLPVMHMAVYRWFWHRAKSLKHDAIPGDDGFGMQATPSVSLSRKTPSQVMLYFSCYLVGIALLLFAFGPFGHQIGLIHFLERPSFGSASFGSLVGLAVGLLPAMTLTVPLVILSGRERREISRGVHDDAETLRLQLKHEWLFSFVAAFVMISLLCFVTGLLTYDYL